jgi:hypothetical protein
MIGPSLRARVRAPMVTLLLLLPTAAASAADEASPRLEAERALAEVMAKSPHGRAVFRVGQPGPSAVTGLSLEVAGEAPSARAQRFVAEHEALVGVPAAALVVEGVRESRHGSSVTMRQRHGGLDVVGREVVVSFDGQGRVIALTSSAAPLTTLVKARIGEQEALAIAQQTLEGARVHDKATPVVVARGAIGAPALNFVASRPAELRAVRVTVDLHEAAVVSVHELTRQ